MKNSIALLTLALLTACGPYSKAPDSIDDAERPKNVILLIGDGMGLTQITAGMYINGNKLHLEQFPVVGLHKPYAADALITDSAAGATAFASGIKTYNGAIGVNMEKAAVKTILEEAEANGLATGLVATSSITHATPASFIAHVPYRTMMEEIATYFLTTEIDLFIGGGLKYFAAREKDQRDLTAELKAKGYNVADFRQSELTRVPVDFEKNFAYFTADGEPPEARQGRDYLAPASKLAPIFLQRRSKQGFFLMIEGSQIDWGGHNQDSDYIISEMIDFDKAIGAALDFARENGQTLVIVTADHETGGYAINPGSRMDSIRGAFTSDYHTGSLIPVFAYGPGARLFAGVYENTAIYDKMRAAFGFVDSPAALTKK